MKKQIAILLSSLFILSACTSATPLSESDQPSSTSSSESTVMDEKPELESEQQLVEDRNAAESETTATLEIKEETKEIPPFMDELSAMTPGPYDYIATLEDVSGGNGTGSVGASYNDAGYNIYATFENLPEPEDDFFYEGWIVRKSPLSVLSTGKANTDDKLYTNRFKSQEDLTDHVFYVLTLEPDDGDPAPAEHILEGTLIKN